MLTTLLCAVDMPQEKTAIKIVIAVYKIKYYEENA
jgi:hypothetical protein